MLGQVFVQLTCPFCCEQTPSAVGLRTVLGLSQDTNMCVPCLLMVLLVLSCQQSSYREQLQMTLSSSWCDDTLGTQWGECVILICS